MALIQLSESVLKYSPVTKNPKGKVIGKENRQLTVNLFKIYSKEEHSQCITDI